MNQADRILYRIAEEITDEVMGAGEYERLNGFSPSKDMPVVWWVIYDHPKDFPQSYVARRWEGDVPTSDIIVAADLNVLRKDMRSRGLFRILRNDGDDPVIVESWL